MEDSEFSSGIRQELVDAGYMDLYEDVKQAEEAINDGPIVLSKLALITTTKDGVLRHRLIFDCRVSGTNDRAVKHERIILPSAWDVVHGVLIMKAKSADTDEFYLLCATTRTRSSSFR